MSDEALKNLATAVVEQAVKDWRALCDGKKPSSDCNFAELERFFEKDCANYLSGGEPVAKQIYEQLKNEREKQKAC